MASVGGVYRKPPALFGVVFGLVIVRIVILLFSSF